MNLIGTSRARSLFLSACALCCISILASQSERVAADLPTNKVNPTKANSAKTNLAQATPAKEPAAQTSSAKAVTTNADSSSKPVPVPAPAPKPLPKLTSAQQRQLGSAIYEYRNNPKDPAKRAAAVARAVKLGPEGCGRMLITVVNELEPQVRKYRDNFAQRAAVETKAKLQTVTVSEVQELRDAVLNLAKDEQLAKEQIVAKADPAMLRLAELLLVNRADILAKYPELPKQRAALRELGGYWETCMTALDEFHSGVPDQPRQKPSFAEFLKREEELAVKLAGPITDQDRQVLAVNTRHETHMDPEEARCLLELNLLRTLLGLNALAFDKALLAAARDHSHDMEELNFFAHESPLEGKKTSWDRAKNFGASANGENIFLGSLQGLDAHLAWFHSPGHFKNQLGGHARVGIGRQNRHWTQLFGR